MAILLRTWLEMGLVEPVTVAGSSMAPTLLGPHASVQCERCQNGFDVGAEFAAVADEAECPQCGFQKNSLAELPVNRGDRLLIDRTAFTYRIPERWEPVVFASPMEEGGLVVKRVVGLPGETIQLRDGELWTNGRLAKKPLATQRTLRSLVHKETAAANRWRGSGWTWRNNSWNCESETDWQWLSYEHPGKKPITDDSAHNAGLTRRLFEVRDLCLSMRLQTTGNGDFAIRMNADEKVLEIKLNPSAGTLEYLAGEKILSRKELSTEALRNLQNREVQLELSFCDQQLLVAIEGRVEFIQEKVAEVEFHDPRPLFSVGARNLSVTLCDLQVYRDIYYASREESQGFKEPMVPVTLGERDIFVLGDNVPISLDSRHWGPLPLRFLVGRPLGVR
ncbi:Signal peptidase I V [Bythopirellula goksoeyrii]|uniref:Signal peptidase I n=1 Tax=Bythopirellula goksoeyrii TaxID=1400387 RepID=A0A5B9QL31_9BACT|nr:Signal peptidase I V [Bythopirellula goksoeyrii]